MAHAASHSHHVIPKAVLFKVFGGLVFLTFFTVITAQFDFGAFNVPLALLIAGTKGYLVVSFFMALRYDSKVNTLAFLMGTIFVVIFLVFTMFDTAFRGDLSNVDAEMISDIELREEAMRRGEPAPGTQRIPMGTFESDSLALNPGAVPVATDSAASEADTTAAHGEEAADTTAAGGQEAGH